MVPSIGTAMGAGVGSASMMAAATAPIIAVYPDYEQQIMVLQGCKLVDYRSRRILWPICFFTSYGKNIQLLFTGRTREQDLAEEAANHE